MPQSDQIRDLQRTPTRSHQTNVEKREKDWDPKTLVRKCHKVCGSHCPTKVRSPDEAEDSGPLIYEFHKQENGEIKVVTIQDVS